MRRDFYVNDLFDMEFSESGGFKEVDGNQVLFQNFMFIAREYVRPLVGDNPSSTQLSRVINRMKAEYESRESVDNFKIQEFTVDNNELSFTVSINSDEFSEQVSII